MEIRTQYSLLLLAGGKSSRMGSPKPELMYQGKSFLDHMLSKARALGIEKCYISGYSAPAEGVESIPDQYSDRGPLGGIHACMTVMDTPYCLILPVDAPTLPLEILRQLLTAHEKSPDPRRILIWEHGDRPEPLIAVYPTAMSDAIEDLIQDSPAPVFRMLDLWGYDRLRIEIGPEQIVNVNTPELYAKITE